MGKLVIQIPPEIEFMFRQEAAKRFGYRKGSLKKAIEEALKVWILLTPDEIENVLKRWE